MITKFISGLSEQAKKLLIIAAIVAIAALFDRVLIAPTLARIAAIDEETAKEEATIKQDIHFLGYKNKIIKESHAIEPYLTESLPAENDIVDSFLKKIEMLASKSNVVLSKETRPTGQQDKNYLKYSVDVECTGKLADIVTFMHMINTSKDLMKVSKLNLGSKAEDVKATMTISKAIISQKDLTIPSNPGTTSVEPDASKTKTN